MKFLNSIWINNYKVNILKKKHDIVSQRKELIFLPQIQIFLSIYLCNPMSETFYLVVVRVDP